MSDNFKKVLEFSNLLLLTVKQKGKDLEEQNVQKSILMDKQHRMQEQVIEMQEQWKREQQLVKELEEEL